MSDQHHERIGTASARARTTPHLHSRSPLSITDLTVDGATAVVDVEAVARDMAEVAGVYAADLHTTLTIDGPRLLTERELLSATRHRPTAGRSLRGATAISPTADGWIAVNLARPEDRESLAAVTAGAASNDDADWLAWLARTPTAEAVHRCRLLGLAAGALPETPAPTAAPFFLSDGAPRAPRAVGDLIVVDFSRLWAGPLAGALLAEAGLQVMRVVDGNSPPPVSADDAAFDDRLHGAKTTHEIDMRDREAVARLTLSADVLITSMRPSALERFPPPRPDAVHLAISAHGPGEPDRAGFGDDCAFDGGLVAFREGRPEFCGDAVADPLTGLLAASTALGMLTEGLSGRVDLALAQTARWVVGTGRR